MKNPWVIGLLSLVPGLGLFVLGEKRKALAAAAASALLVAAALTFRTDTVFTIVFVATVAVWTVQWMFALTYAQRRAGMEAGTAPAVRPVTLAPLTREASAGEKALHNARQLVMQVLPPGENLAVALNGTLGAPSLASSLIALVTGAHASMGRFVYLGITGKDLILIGLDALGKPSTPQRIPLDRVKLVNSSESTLSDEFLLDTGEGKPLHFKVGKSLHEGTRQLVAILSGRREPEAGVRAWQQAAVAPLSSPEPLQSSGVAGSKAPSHPILTSAFLGAAGGATGVIAAGIILLVLGMIFGEALFGTPDFGEGLGILLGIYCVVMFPAGGGILGAIPGAALGWLRASRDEPLNAPLLALAGFLTILLLTAGAIAALFLLVPG